VANIDSIPSQGRYLATRTATMDLDTGRTGEWDLAWTATNTVKVATTQIGTLYMSNGNMRPMINGGTSSMTTYNPPMGAGRISRITGTDCHMQEVISYVTALSDYDRQRVEGYLAWKWGIQSNLPTTHLFYSAAPRPTVTSNIVSTGLIVNFDATAYAGTGAWSNLGSLGATTVPTARVENGTASKNKEGTGVVLNGATNFAFSTIGFQSSFTAGAWFKRTGTTGTAACIVTENYSGGSLNISIFGNDSPIAATDFAGGFFTGSWRRGNSINFSTNIWTNITVTYDGTTMTTYSNASLVGTSNLTGIATSSNPYRIGRRWDNADYVVGELGQVCIYSRPLSAAEVGSNFQAKRALYGV
jgi:hypothetical protein